MKIAKRTPTGRIGRDKDYGQLQPSHASLDLLTKKVKTVGARCGHSDKYVYGEYTVILDADEIERLYKWMSESNERAEQDNKR